MEHFFCLLSKIGLNCLTVYWSEANSVLPTVYLNFSWTLEMSERQNNWFLRVSVCLSSSLSPTWHHLEALSKPIFSKWMNFRSNHWKKNNCMFNKISPLFQTVIESEARSSVPTVQLQFNLDTPNVWSTKCLVRKSIWWFEQFP